jgi:MFS family permease
MTTATANQAASPAPRGLTSRLFHRELDHYPDDRVRYTQLALVVAITVVLYYENYVSSGVANQLLASLHMSFTYFVTILAIANLVGALASIAAGLADRFGRASLVVFGLLISSAVMAFALPNAGSKATFGIETAIVGLVEGVILVATPALVRDFSPQVGRATAMGFWTMGPVLGSLVVSVVATLTLPSVNPDWQGQYRICGVVGLATFVVALVGLRELSPSLRDQLIVSVKERVLVEARALGIDIEASSRQPFRQMLHLDVVASAIGVSLLLLIYFTTVAFGVLYLVTVFGFSQGQANAISNWEWGADAASLLIVGYLSDKLRVRKPFMLVGGVASAVMIAVFLSQATHHPSYSGMAVLVALVAAALGCAYGPWLASFTETVEARNPALTATGLSIWGLIIRLVVFVSFLIIPHVVNSVTALADYGPQIQAIAKEYPAQYATATKDPALITELSKTPTDPHLLAQARQVYGPTYLSQLLALQKVKTQFLPLSEHGVAVQAAQAETGRQWQHWYWVCFAGALLFLPLMLVMRGRWSPAKAKADAEAHEAEVQTAIAALSSEPTGGN